MSACDQNLTSRGVDSRNGDPINPTIKEIPVVDHGIGLIRLKPRFREHVVVRFRRDSDLWKFGDVFRPDCQDPQRWGGLWIGVGPLVVRVVN